MVRDGAHAGCQDPVLCAAAICWRPTAQTSRLRACRERVLGAQRLDSRITAGYVRERR